MGDVVQFPMDGEDMVSGAFYESGKALSEFIQRLPISKADNDKLISLMLAHVENAEIHGWVSGYLDGLGE